MYIALKSFIGKVSMNLGETKEFIEKNIADDLIKAGLIEEIKSEKPVKSKEKVKTSKKKK